MHCWGGWGREQDNMPACLKLLGFLLLPPPDLLPALGLQGITTAREVMWNKKDPGSPKPNKGDPSMQRPLKLNKK